MDCTVGGTAEEPGTAASSQDQHQEAAVAVFAA